MVKQIVVRVDDELFEKLRGLKSRRCWTWEDLMEEILRRCR